MEVNTTTTADPLNMYNYVNNFVLNPVVFIIIILIIIGYLVIFSSLGNNNNNNQQIIAQPSNNNSYFYYGQSFLGVLVIVIIVILLLINGFQYFFNIDATAYLKNLFTNKPEIDIRVNQNSKKPHNDDDDDDDGDNHDNDEHHDDNDKISLLGGTSIPGFINKKQVFNIPNNKYTYNDAKAICNAYGAELANYQQVESAYKNGAEWCNYGWSDGQMALFPTQQNTFHNLQKIKGHEHDCGRPGINGGYIANPEIKFGVNCYGNKPKITHDEEELMKTSSPYPKTMQEIEFQRKVDYWKNKINELLISPFNYNMWGEV
jgi:hypothetical protein